MSKKKRRAARHAQSSSSKISDISSEGENVPPDPPDPPDTTDSSDTSDTSSSVTSSVETPLKLDKEQNLDEEQKMAFSSIMSMSPVSVMDTAAPPSAAPSVTCEPPCVTTAPVTDSSISTMEMSSSDFLRLEQSFLRLEQVLAEVDEDEPIEPVHTSDTSVHTSDASVQTTSTALLSSQSSLEKQAMSIIKSDGIKTCLLAASIVQQAATTINRFFKKRVSMFTSSFQVRIAHSVLERKQLNYLNYLQDQASIHGWRKSHPLGYMGLPAPSIQSWLDRTTKDKIEYLTHLLNQREPPPPFLSSDEFYHRYYTEAMAFARNLGDKNSFKDMHIINWYDVTPITGARARLSDADMFDDMYTNFEHPKHKFGYYFHPPVYIKYGSATGKHFQRRRQRGKLKHEQFLREQQQQRKQRAPKFHRGKPNFHRDIDDDDDKRKPPRAKPESTATEGLSFMKDTALTRAIFRAADFEFLSTGFPAKPVLESSWPAHTNDRADDHDKPRQSTFESSSRFEHDDPFIVNVQRTLRRDDDGSKFVAAEQTTAIRSSVAHAFEQPAPYDSTALVDALAHYSDDDYHDRDNDYDDRDDDTHEDDDHRDDPQRGTAVHFTEYDY